MSKFNDTPIWAGGKIVGYVRGDVFCKAARGSRHMLRRPKAWALDIQSLRDAEAAGAKRVAIDEKETDRTYVASTALIWRRGFRFNRGFGEQIGLALEFWRVERPGGPSQLALALGGAS